MDLLRNVKRWIITSGVPPSARIDFCNALLALGQWLKTHPAPIHLESREKLYDRIAGQMKGEPFDFIEAGVFRGDSIRYWAKLSSCPESRFFGFDTFTGLPEAWHAGIQTFKIGHFGVGGALPLIQDERVRFIKGRFQDTVPEFLRTYSRQKNLIIHCDADIYTSTLFFLASFHEIMRAGTYLLFDNFSVAPHDFRAFCDYTNSFCRAYEIVATAEVDFEKIAFLLK